MGQANSKRAVIDNIQKAVKEQRFNDKVEVGDPELSSEQIETILTTYLQQRQRPGFRAKVAIARRIMDSATLWLNRSTQIQGLANLTDFRGGAIVTSNHFHPTENTAIRKALNQAGLSRLHIVSQVTNLAMPGILGFLMNYADIIPISMKPTYIGRDFPEIIEETLQAGHPILIYPEQEMWFNYRKPRPVMRGPYYYAARFHVPIISCFTEIIDTGKPENNEFNQTRYVVHILKPIYPDANKTVRDNSQIMREQDYAQKKTAYEKAYGRRLDYRFETSDIAGWRGNN